MSTVCRECSKEGSINDNLNWDMLDRTAVMLAFVVSADSIAGISRVTHNLVERFADRERAHHEN